MTGEDVATVLIVDDEADLAELYSSFLDNEYDVRTATSGAEALGILDETIDVALLDRRMPDMSGDELLAQIRGRDLDVQVAMLTAVEPDGEILEMPFDDYKVKPLTENDLTAIVETLLKRATYDERSQELFRVISKKASLKKADKDDTDEYQELDARLEELRKDVDGTLDELIERVTI